MALEGSVDECPHGMEDPSWCSICKHKDDLIVPRDGADSEYNFVARFKSHCTICRNPIDIGDDCVHLPGRGNFHVSCV